MALWVPVTRSRTRRDSAPLEPPGKARRAAPVIERGKLVGRPPAPAGVRAPAPLLHDGERRRLAVR